MLDRKLPLIIPSQLFMECLVLPKYRRLTWPQQERTVNGKTEFLLFYPVSVSTLDTFKKKLRSYLQQGLPAVVLAWHRSPGLIY